MGWSGGSEIGTSFWESVRECIPIKDREFVAKELINALEEQDCDTVYECEQLVTDAGLEDEYFGEEE